MVYLVVVRSFGPYRIGDVARDAAEVERVLASEHASHVVRMQPAGSTANSEGIARAPQQPEED